MPSFASDSHHIYSWLVALANLHRSKIFMCFTANILQSWNVVTIVDRSQSATRTSTTRRRVWYIDCPLFAIIAATAKGDRHKLRHLRLRRSRLLWYEAFSVGNKAAKSELIPKCNDAVPVCTVKCGQKIKKGKQKKTRKKMVYTKMGEREHRGTKKSIRQQKKTALVAREE